MSEGACEGPRPFRNNVLPQNECLPEDKGVQERTEKKLFLLDLATGHTYSNVNDLHAPACKLLFTGVSLSRAEDQIAMDPRRDNNEKYGPLSGAFSKGSSMRNSLCVLGDVACRMLGPMLLLFTGACATDGNSDDDKREASKSVKAKYSITVADTLGLSQAIFAGGCFWCEETAFEGVRGVRAVISGFVGGKEAEPTYEDVSSGKTGHAEAVLVTFDPGLITYDSLLEIFWVNHDPTTNDRQFCDRGRQYRPGIFYLNDDQKRRAEASVDWANEHKRFTEPILTEITKATPFWPAEEYHQDFYKKNPERYNSYRIGCRRDARLAELWKAPANASH